MTKSKDDEENGARAGGSNNDIFPECLTYSLTKRILTPVLIQRTPEARSET